MTGNYPNPFLALNSVTTPAIIDNAITTTKVLDGTITTQKIPDGAITSAKILDQGIATSDLADGSVVSSKLGIGSVDSARIADGGILSGDLTPGAIHAAQLGPTVVESIEPPVTVKPGQEQRVAMSCPEGSVLLSGGGVWRREGNGNDPRNVFLNYSAPGAPNTWEIGIQNNNGQDQAFFARVVCLKP